MIRAKRYGEVRAFEVARSLAGRAIWTVRAFLLGEVLIDTGPPNMRRMRQTSRCSETQA
jgi:hypothetical protein